MTRFLENRARYRANNPENPPDICGCVEKGCDNPMPQIKGAKVDYGTIPCPVCGGTMCIRSLYDCENCEDGRVPCECECHGGEK